MATDNHTAPAVGSTTADTIQRELIIEIYPRNYVEYKGTLAQLREEGLIPAGLEIPIRNRWEYWSANGFDYQLRRTRPDDLKGQMKLWIEGDYWFVRRGLTGTTDGYLKAGRKTC